TEDAVLMVEAGAKEVSEEAMLEAIAFGHEHCKRLAKIQKELAARAAKPRWQFDPNAGKDPVLEARVRELAQAKLSEALATPDKHARAQAVHHVFDEVWAALGVDESKKGQARVAFEAAESTELRRMIIEQGVRLDGRKPNEIRPISIETGYLPRAHGSGLFTRGETQALVSATLGTKSDEQKIEALEGETWRHFLLHYNFPSFSVGEVRRFGGPSRRDIGHGALAERAVEAVLPAKEDFPYTIRVVSDILEAIEKPRPELRPYAPRFVTIKIRQEKIREIIGPGGKVVRGIQEQTGTKIDIEDDGRVTVFSSDQASVQKAIAIIQDICREVELDRIYLGKVKKIVEFG